MSTRNVVYIAGPFGAPTPEEIEKNVQRALALGRLAVACGLAPIIPHAMGRLEVYGCPHERDDGTSRRNALDDGTSRRNALECGIAGAAAVARAGGLLWIILRDDKTRSPGTTLEETAYFASDAPRLLCVADTWEGWRPDFEKHGMFNEWERVK